VVATSMGVDFIVAPGRFRKGFIPNIRTCSDQFVAGHRVRLIVNDQQADQQRCVHTYETLRNNNSVSVVGSNHHEYTAELQTPCSITITVYRYHTGPAFRAPRSKSYWKELDHRIARSITLVISASFIVTPYDEGRNSVPSHPN
jgi:hypothetical protein